MLFRETTAFTAGVSQLLDDDAYAALQAYLHANPTAGPVIRGTGGARKLRWSRRGIGKRGGVRIIYAYLPARARVYFLLIYAKSDREDLTPGQRKMLAVLLQDD